MAVIVPGSKEFSALSIITLAVGEIGAKGLGETLEAEEADDCLERLNFMLDMLSADGLMMYSLTEEGLLLTAGATSRTIGEGGDFDTERPERICKESYIRDSGGNDSQVEIITKDQYNRISDKSPGNSYPTKLYYDPAVPLGTIYFDAPSDGTHTLYLVSEKPFTAFTALNDTVQFPAGYKEMFVYNLAARLAGPFRKTLSPVTASIATSTLRQIQNRNAAQRPIRARTAFPTGMQSSSSASTRFNSGT